MQKITPCLWFDNQAEEAVNFYLSLFTDGKINKVSKRPDGSVLTMIFQLNGQNFMALNGGPHFKFNEAVSLVINCKDQQEIDYFWEKLTSAGGKESMCGWLKDKYGLSWQIVPESLDKLMTDSKPEKSQRVMEALLKMKKIDLNILEKAYDEN